MSTTDQVSRTGYDYYFGVFLALFGSVSGSGVYVVCRKLGTQLHVSVHPFYMAVISGFCGVWLLSFSRYSISGLTSYDFMMLTLCGVCSWVQQESQAIALQIEKGGRSAAVNYLIVVNAFLADIILFGETVQISDLLGAVCIVFFTFLNALLKCFGKTK